MYQALFKDPIPNMRLPIVLSRRGLVLCCAVRAGRPSGDRWTCSRDQDHQTLIANTPLQNGRCRLNCNGCASANPYQPCEILRCLQYRLHLQQKAVVHWDLWCCLALPCGILFCIPNGPTVRLGSPCCATNTFLKYSQGSPR